MNERFQGKILVMVSLAALVGMDGFFSLLDRKIRGAGNELATQVQTSPADNIVMNMPRLASKPLCTQNDLPFGDQPELQDDRVAAPLTDEEFERIERNADQEDILRNASNDAFGQKAPYQQA